MTGDPAAGYVVLRWLSPSVAVVRGPRQPAELAAELLPAPTGEAEFAALATELSGIAALAAPGVLALREAARDPASGRTAVLADLEAGGSLAHPAGPLTGGQVLAAVAAAARGVHALHETGLVHRAVRPSRVLLASGGGAARIGRPEPASAAAAQRSVTMAAAGLAPDWLDPALVRGARPSRGSDIWALGAVAHWALTGRSLYPDAPAGNDLLATVRFLARAAPVVDPALPADLAAVLRACLAGAETDRPSTALELAGLLDGMSGLPGLAAERVPARPAGAEVTGPDPFAPLAARPLAGPPRAGDPLPVAGRAAPASVELVDGVMCRRGHFNKPTAGYCAACGLSMLQQTHQVVKGPRPPLGVLVLDDGSAASLDAGYVIGRSPEREQSVLGGSARPLAIAGDPSVSAVHAEIRLAGWEAHLRDLHSTNGTYVAAPGAGSWTRLEPGRPHPLAPGTSIAVGDRTLVFESALPAG